MRHKKKGKKLNRNTHQRKALFKRLIQSLILNEELKTTESKAKAIKGLVDKLITKAKKGGLSVRRQILAFLQNKKITAKLIDEIAPRCKSRTSGFTKIIRLGKRRGDKAMMVKMELTEKKKKEKKNKKGEKKNSKKSNKKLDGKIEKKKK